MKHLRNCFPTLGLVLICSDIVDLHVVGIILGLHNVVRFSFKAFWNDFPTGRMNKTGFVKYYDEIKDGKDRANILCEYDHLLN